MKLPIRPMIRFAIILCSLPLVSCHRKSEEPQLPIATVNSEGIPFSKFIVFYNRAKQELDTVARADPKTIDLLKEKTLNKIVFETLIQQEATKRNIVVTDDELNRDLETIKKDIPQEQFAKSLSDQLLTEEEWRQLHRQKLLAEKVTRVSLEVNRNVPPDVIEAFYKEHKGEYATEKKVQALQIYVKDESLAEDLLKQLRKGANFEELAKKHSLSPDAVKGGDLGFFGRDDMIPEFNAAFDLRPGEVSSQVIKSSYGFHILKTIKVQEPHQMSLSEVRDTIRDKLVEAREEEAYRKWLSELVKRASIKKNQDLLANFDKS